MHAKLIAAALLAGASFSGAAVAGTDAWMVRVGAHNVDPKSDNGSLPGAGGASVTVDNSFGLTFNIDYFFTPRLALDVLAALPFEHDIALNGSQVASAKHLPPTVSLQYHFLPDRRIRPYVGLGLNYTLFFDEQINGGGNLELDDSFGLAAQGGVDFSIAPNWLIGVDLRWIDIDTDVSLNGSDLGTANIDPLAYGATLAYRFGAR